MAEYRLAKAISAQKTVSRATSDSQSYPNQQASSISPTNTRSQPCIDLTTGSYKPAQLVSPTKADAQVAYYNQQPPGFSPVNKTGPAVPIDLTGPSPRQLKIPQPNVHAALSKVKTRESGSYRAPVNGRAVARPETSRKSPAPKASNPLAAQKPTKVTKAKASDALKVTNPIKTPKGTKATQSKAAKLAEILPALCPTHLSELTGRHTSTEPNTQGGSQDPYLTQPVSPPNFVEALKTPAPPSAKDLLEENKVVDWQIKMARHLAITGTAGPYEVGDFLCDVQRATGRIFKLAQRQFCPAKQEIVWGNVLNNKPLDFKSEALCGKVVSLSDGSFQSLNNSNGAMSPQFQVVNPDREAVISPPEEKVYPWKDYPDFDTQVAIALQGYLDQNP